jgi:hypothetical protein
MNPKFARRRTAQHIQRGACRTQGTSSQQMDPRTTGSDGLDIAILQQNKWRFK